MNNKISITGVHYDVDEDIKKYINKKLTRLFRFAGRKASDSVTADVKLKQNPNKDKRQSTCEVIFHLPNENITVTETTTNMHAAFDVVEAKLKTQLKKYKETKSMTHHGNKQNRVRQALGKILPKR
ncbi:MAG: ribosome-associated translation inhibitor RaiA [bacterium]|nr:ribosome-associated translation inhibitor RaiA [bacterium]